MTRDRLRKIRLICCLLAVILWLSGAFLAVRDYQAWKQAAETVEGHEDENPINIDTELEQSKEDQQSSEDQQSGEGQQSGEDQLSGEDQQSGEGQQSGSDQLSGESQQSQPNQQSSEGQQSGSDQLSGESQQSGEDQQSGEGQQSSEGRQSGANLQGEVNQQSGEDRQSQPDQQPEENQQTEENLQEEEDRLREEGTTSIPETVNSVYQSETGFSLSFLSLLFMILGTISAGLAVAAGVMLHRTGETTNPASGPVKVETIKVENIPDTTQTITYGHFNQLGKRARQEDCCGLLPMENEMLAIVADGMGGLKNGEKVSEAVVRSMMTEGQRYQGSSENDILLSMLHKTNENVNRILGGDIYKSGSTMLAVWIQEKGRRFQWATVGDSRMYLYRGGSLIQLNQEHNYGQELLYQAIKGQISFEEARKNPKKAELTSFIGMGQLKYVDHSIRPIELQPGDRILLMSDGVFNTITEQQITDIIRQNSDVKLAADRFVDLIEQCNNPKQDNYTAVILGF